MSSTTRLSAGVSSFAGAAPTTEPIDLLAGPRGPGRGGQRVEQRGGPIEPLSGGPAVTETPFELAEHEQASSGGVGIGAGQVLGAGRGLRAARVDRLGQVERGGLGLAASRLDQRPGSGQRRRDPGPGQHLVASLEAGEALGRSFAVAERDERLDVVGLGPVAQRLADPEPLERCLLAVEGRGGRRRLIRREAGRAQDVEVHRLEFRVDVPAGGRPGLGRFDRRCEPAQIGVDQRPDAMRGSGMTWPIWSAASTLRSAAASAAAQSPAASSSSARWA